MSTLHTAGQRRTPQAESVHGKEEEKDGSTSGPGDGRGPPSRNRRLKGAAPPL